jgi:Uncharacterized conserved protein
VSEIINNREYRQKAMKELILELHNGKNVEEVRERYAKLIEGISPSEISDMEQSIIMEGMPVSEVQRLCDVHAAVFKGSIEEIHHPEQVKGHPMNTFKGENKEIEKLINEKIKVEVEKFRESSSNTDVSNLLSMFKELGEVDKHYLRKENLLFPILEKHGITAPPKVMWGVDDEIRELIRETVNILSAFSGNREAVIQKSEETINKVLEMIFKEENILFPMAIDTLSEDEWIKIYEESDSIGYTFITPERVWKPVRAGIESDIKAEPELNGYMNFETGALSTGEINAIFNALPIDITFIDKDGVVKYFSQGRDRIFMRTKAVIGRKVQNCHPPASVHIVEKLIEDLKSGRKDHEDFWILMGDTYAYIRYFAVRDKDNNFLGTLEVTQDIQPIKNINGEKRLMSD